jgi:ATP-dependent DNA helicase RecG
MSFIIRRLWVSVQTLTKENFGRAGVNDYRNPNLAEAMRHLGYAQHFGVGIQIARETLARNGNPPIEFKFDLGPVMAIIRKKERSSRTKRFKDMK